MLLKGLKLTVIGAGLMFATGAFAEGHKLGFEYRAGITYDDGKLEETTGVDAESSTGIALEAAKFTASGEAAKDVSFMFRYNLLNKEDMMDGVEHGWLNLKFNDMVAFSLGRSKVNQGGWHVKDNWMEFHDVESNGAFAYAMAMPLDTFSDSIGIHLALAGQLSIQILNDVAQETDSTGTVTNPWVKNDSSKSQAASIEWMGNFGGWMPLVQILSYDLNNSQAFSVGVKGSVAGLGLMLNYLSDSRNNNGTDEKDTLSQIDAHFSYHLSHFTPWIAVHSFDNKQGGTDKDTNGASGAFDDNSMAYAIGVECNALGEGYVPYLAINMDNGKYADAAGNEESRGGMIVKAGVSGKF